MKLQVGKRKLEIRSPYSYGRQYFAWVDEPAYDTKAFSARTSLTIILGILFLASWICILLVVGLISGWAALAWIAITLGWAFIAAVLTMLKNAFGDE